jgi:antitoxin component HigA of HigAB toxin-antitoxin module
MEIRPIRTDEDHRAALAAIEACWGAPEGTEEGDKLDVLLALVDIYEAKRWPLEVDESFDPVDVLRYAIDELGIPRPSWQNSGLALARFGSSLAAARTYGRDDPQDRRGVENSGRPSCSSLQDRASRLSRTFADSALGDASGDRRAAARSWIPGGHAAVL